MGRGAWRATVHRVAKLNMTKALSTHRQSTNQQDRVLDSTIKRSQRWMTVLELLLLLLLSRFSHVRFCETP